jgi:2,5-dioxopentanoate dehydrogenase
MSYKDFSVEEIDVVMKEAWNAFHVYRKFSLQQRAAFMKAIAVELESCGDALIQTAMQETNLPEARLRGERARTIFQLNSYAEACEKGNWLEARIDTAIADKTPPKPDIRKMLVPLGPVVVFGASNFPFAYSTAGGDGLCLCGRLPGNCKSTSGTCTNIGDCCECNFSCRRKKQYAQRNFCACTWCRF